MVDACWTCDGWVYGSHSGTDEDAWWRQTGKSLCCARIFFCVVIDVIFPLTTHVAIIWRYCCPWLTSMPVIGSYCKLIYSSVASLCMTPARRLGGGTRKSGSCLSTVQYSSFYIHQLLLMPPTQTAFYNMCFCFQSTAVALALLRSELYPDVMTWEKVHVDCPAQSK